MVESEKLEKAPREAVRIITRLPPCTRMDALYFETGFETVCNRRKRRKFQLLYKIHNKITPDFLNQLLRPSVGENNRYALRNNNDYRIPSFRLSPTNASFIPSSLQSWNALDNSVRSLSSLNSFKTSSMSNIQPPLPIYFKFGDLKLNIVIQCTKLRQQCSSLNYDLYRANLVNSAACNCGNPCENVFH